MHDFDRLAFEQHMGEAVDFHRQGNYEAALLLSTQAYDIAPANSFEKGRAARDISARYDRLGKYEEAESWAREAHSIHDGLVKSMDEPTREAFRERSVSAMNVGVNGLRKIIMTRKAGEQVESLDTLAMMQQILTDLAAAKAQAGGLNHIIDQYEINAARRVSMTESLIGSKKLGIAVGARAVALAFWSESPRLDTTNHNLKLKQRLQVKTKALVGGIAALGVGLLSLPSNHRSQQLAVTLAAKTL